MTHPRAGAVAAASAVLAAVLLSATGASQVSAQAAPKPAPPTTATTAPPAAKARPTPPPAVAIEGVVRGPDRKPVEKALVIAAVERERNFLATPSAPLTARTDAQGRFRIVLPRREKRTVRVESAGLAARTLKDVAPGTPLAIDLARGGRIEGTVRDGDTGQPVAGARVEARDREAVAVTAEAEAGLVVARSDANGRFALDGLPPAFQTIVARSTSGGFASRANVRIGSRVDLLLFPAASVSGTVTGPDGRPVAGAVVQTYGRDVRGPVAESTDGNGRFALYGLAPGAYSVVATAPRLAPAVASNVVLERRSEAQVELRLGAGARVVGRLVDPRERPLAGQVGVFELDGQPAPHQLAGALAGEAGPDGRFALDRVPAGQHRLGVVAPGHAVQMVDVAVRPADREVDVGDVRLEVGLAIRGRVRDPAGQPVEGAMLLAMAMRRSDGPLPSARSEADGSFVLAGLQQNPYRVMVDAQGYARADQPAEPGGDPLEIVLQRGGQITGRVVDDRSRAIEDFSVVARPVEQRGFRFPRPSDVTIAEGQFTLQGLAEGAYALTVSSPERASTTVSGVRVAAGATVDVGTVTLGAGGVVRGTVVDDTGASVAGASVMVRGQGREWLAYPGNEPQATTEAGGAFEVKGVRAGSAQVTASHPNYASSEPSFVEVDPAKGAADVRLVLSQGGRVAGSVRRRDGTALTGVEVRVSASSRSGRGSANVEPSPVQADGSFAVEHVPAGRATVLVMPSASRGFELGGLTRTVEVRDGETTTVDIVARDILLSGRATRSGTPAPGLRLEAAGRGRFPGEFGGPGTTGGPQRLTAVTREDGSFEMLLDEPGTVTLSATSADGRTRLPSRTIEVPDADAHSVELTYDGVVVSGLVVDRETDAPLPFASVMAAPKSAGPGGVGGTAGQDGRFQLELEPGTYRLFGRVRDEGYGTAETEIGVGSSGLADVKLALPKGLSIAGRVTDAAGRPVGGTQIFAYAGAPTYRDTGWGESLADGTFSIGGLKAGTFVLTASTDAGQFGMLPSVAAGSKSLALVLRPGATLDVSVVGPEGEPISAAWPRVTRLDGTLVQAMGRARAPTDAQGSTVMTVPSGQVFVGVQQGPLTGGTPIDVGPGERAAVRIKLHRSPEGPAQ